MASNCGLLVKEATMLLDKFDPSKQCLNFFMEDATKAMENINELDEMFITDILHGCVEFKLLLDVVVDAFYAQHVKCVSRGDRSQFVVMCYLATFRLDDLGLKGFGNIIKSLDFKKMHQLMSFFFNVTNLTTWIQGEWSQIYDASFVETNWIAPLLRWCPEMAVLMDQLSVEMSYIGQVKKAVVKTTVPQEFSLTKPKPRALPLPELVPLQEKHRPAPDSSYRAPKEVHAIAEDEHRNHEKAESNSWPKLNKTAILRAGALYDRKEEEELMRIKRLREGECEPSSFLQWQKVMQEQDLQEELAQVDRWRQEGRRSHEEAKARSQLKERNQKTAQLQKEEMAQLMQKYAKKRLQEEKGMRELVQQVAESHKNSKAAKRKLQEWKQDIVKEVSQQNRELLCQALEKEQEELSSRFQLIQEIRAIESAHAFRHKFADETETAGHRLLGEMSLAELRQRLALKKEAEWREKLCRRERILEEKQHKEQQLLERLDLLNLNWEAQAQARALRKEEKTRRLRAQQQTASEEKGEPARQKTPPGKNKEQPRLRQSEGVQTKASETASARNATTWKPKQEEQDEQWWAELERRLEREVQRGAQNTVSHCRETPKK